MVKKKEKWSYVANDWDCEEEVVNCDVVWNKASWVAGVGVIDSDHRGHVLDIKGYPMIVGNILVAEAYAIKEGLDLIVAHSGSIPLQKSIHIWNASHFAAYCLGLLLQSCRNLRTLKII